MSQEQLRQAFDLMKQGKKSEAIVIVRGVLQDDMNNVNAWLLMTNLMDDERKKLKALERLLAINPEHGGALRMLQKLNPNDPRLVQQAKPETDNTGFAEKTKKESYDWSKLEKAKKPPLDPRVKYAYVLGLFGLVFILGTALVWSPATYVFDEDKNGAKPEEVAVDFIQAILWFDFEKARSMACPTFHDDIDAIEQDMLAGGLNYLPSDYHVDWSDVTTENVDTTRNKVIVAFHGVIVTTGGGETLEYDIDEAAREEQVDWMVQHVNRVDGVWLACDGPDFIFRW